MVSLPVCRALHHEIEKMDPTSGVSLPAMMNVHIRLSLNGIMMILTTEIYRVFHDRIASALCLHLSLLQCPLWFLIFLQVPGSFQESNGFWLVIVDFSTTHLAYITGSYRHWARPVELLIACPCFHIGPETKLTFATHQSVEDSEEHAVGPTSSVTKLQGLGPSNL